MALNWEALLGATRNLGNVVDTRLNRRANVVQGGIDRVLDMLRSRAERRQQREMPGIEAEAALAEVKGTPSATAEGWAKVYPGMDPSAALEKGMAIGPLAQAKGKLAEIRGALPAQAEGAQAVFGGDAASALGREATIGLTEQIDADVERARQISEQITMPEMREGARLEGEAREDEQAYGQGQFDEEMRYRYASLAQDKRLRELAIEAENGRAAIAQAKEEGLWEDYAIILDQIAAKDEMGQLDRFTMVQDLPKYRNAFLSAAKAARPEMADRLGKIFDAVAATWELVENADFPAGGKDTTDQNRAQFQALVAKYYPNMNPQGGLGFTETERAWLPALDTALEKIRGLDQVLRAQGLPSDASNKTQIDAITRLIQDMRAPKTSYVLTGQTPGLDQIRAALRRFGIAEPPISG